VSSIAQMIQGLSQDEKKALTTTLNKQNNPAKA
jgi:hypothetical protein